MFAPGHPVHYDPLIKNFSSGKILPLSNDLREGITQEVSQKSCIFGLNSRPLQFYSNFQGSNHVCLLLLKSNKKHLSFFTELNGTEIQTILDTFLGASFCYIINGSQCRYGRGCPIQCPHDFFYKINKRILFFINKVQSQITSLS